MKPSITIAKCVTFVVAAALGIGLSPRALACGKQVGGASFSPTDVRGRHDPSRSPAVIEDGAFTGVRMFRSPDSTTQLTGYRRCAH
jgi:hypothetical protein